VTDKKDNPNALVQLLHCIDTYINEHLLASHGSWTAQPAECWKAH